MVARQRRVLTCLTPASPSVPPLRSFRLPLSPPSQMPCLTVLRQHPPKHSSQSLSLQQHQWRCNNIIPNTHICRFPCNNTSGTTTTSLQHPSLSLQQHQRHYDNTSPNTNLGHCECNNTSSFTTTSLFVIHTTLCIYIYIYVTCSNEMSRNAKHKNLSYSHHWKEDILNFTTV